MKNTLMLKNKKGVLGLNTVKAFLVGILAIAVISVAVIITLSALNGTSIATNQTMQIEGNVSDGIVDFFSNSGTFFTLLAVVVIILIIAIVVIAVNRFGGTGEGGL